MSSIVSIVTVFMATFVLVFGYLSFSEQEVTNVEADAPTAAVSELSP